MPASKTFNHRKNLAVSVLLGRRPCPCLFYLFFFSFTNCKRQFIDIEYAARPKLRLMEKVPQYPSHVRPPKMQKRLRLMRGPELVHNTLLHRQYGVIAEGGGRLKFPHYELMRLHVGRRIDIDRMFAIWRIPAPWQPLTKKGVGVRMGSGKGAIDHYATPIKAGRVILEIAGHCEYEEVVKILNHVAISLPFKARAVSQEILDKMDAEKEEKTKLNLNPYTKQYVIQNNLCGCHRWLSPNDHKYFGEHL